MNDIWVAISPREKTTRLIAMSSKKIFLKATLDRDAKHARALATLLEALALWQGAHVRGVLVADSLSTMCGTNLFRNLEDELHGAPLFTLGVVWDGVRDEQIELTEIDHFDDLYALLIREVTV